MGYLIVGVLAILAGLWLGRVTAPKEKVVHHNHKDEKAIYEAYLKGMRDYAQLMRDAITEGVRLSPHPKNRSLMNIIDPRITEVVGEVHISKRCNYQVEWFDTAQMAALSDRPSNVPSDFIRIWDQEAQDYSWRKPA